jgi:hypothetical protein
MGIKVQKFIIDDAVLDLIGNEFKFDHAKGIADWLKNSCKDLLERLEADGKSWEELSPDILAFGTTRAAPQMPQHHDRCQGNSRRFTSRSGLGSIKRTVKSADFFSWFCVRMRLGTGN